MAVATTSEPWQKEAGSFFPPGANPKILMHDNMKGMFRHRNAFTARSPMGSSRKWLMPVIGSITPLGLIAVNVAEFIAQHLAEFRWAITVLAFVSGTMLNSWALLKVYGDFQGHHPDHPIVASRNQEVILIIGMSLVLLTAGVTALFCYEGLAQARNLPNEITLFTSILALSIPFLLTEFFERRTRRRTRRETPPLP